MTCERKATEGRRGRERRPGRRAALALGAVIALQAGCATVPPPPTDYQGAVGRVVVIAGPTLPELHFEGFARGRGEGALAGGASTFGACAQGLGHGSCSGAACGAVVIVWLGVCGVAGLVGAVAGAASATPAEAVRGEEAALRARLEAADIQGALRDQVVAAGGARHVAIDAGAAADAAGPARDYRALAALGVDTVLETSLVRAGLTGAGIDDPVAAYMEVRVRLVRAVDNAELFAAEYAYGGERRRLSEWSADHGAPLEGALERGFEALGAHVADEVFLRYRLPDPGPHAAGILAAAFGLAPESPRTRGQLSGDRLIGDRFEWTEVASLRPTLRWQAFPRESDRVAAPEEMARVKNVRYDLLVARERNLAPAEIVYRRDGLPGPSHTLTVPLEPGARYFWTVRARFELDGRERVIEWGSTHYLARGRLTAPSQFSYRFRAPG